MNAVKKEINSERSSVPQRYFVPVTQISANGQGRKAPSKLITRRKRIWSFYENRQEETEIQRLAGMAWVHILNSPLYHLGELGAVLEFPPLFTIVHTDFIGFVYSPNFYWASNMCQALL